MKNKFMRIAAMMLMAVLVTCTVLGGTMAKYTTSQSGSDSARVAKFGVQLSADNDDNFSTEYETDDSNYSGTLTVKTSDTAKLVAPGTTGNVAKFVISGKPEVATKVDIDMTVNSDVHLGEYYPVEFTLTQNGTTVASGKLTDIENAIETYAATAYYAPNTDLGAEFELNWAWSFDGDDEKDTQLGDIAAEPATAGENDSIKIDYTVTFTVTQVD